MITRRFISDYYIIREGHIISEDKRSVQRFDLFNLPLRIKALLGEKSIDYPLASERVTVFDKARLQCMNCGKDGIYEFQFLRLRDHIQPDIATPDGGLRTYYLEEGEQPAESASALFDPLTQMFVLQRNHFGANATFVRVFLHELFYDHEKGNNILFDPIAQGRVDLGSLRRHDEADPQGRG